MEHRNDYNTVSASNHHERPSLLNDLNWMLLEDLESGDVSRQDCANNALARGLKSLSTTQENNAEMSQNRHMRLRSDSDEMRIIVDALASDVASTGDVSHMTYNAIKEIRDEHNKEIARVQRQQTLFAMKIADLISANNKLRSDVAEMTVLVGNACQLIRVSSSTIELIKTSIWTLWGAVDRLIRYLPYITGAPVDQSRLPTCPLQVGCDHKHQ